MVHKEDPWYSWYSFLNSKIKNFKPKINLDRFNEISISGYFYLINRNVLVISAIILIML
jgi:hypothetical protein